MDQAFLKGTGKRFPLEYPLFSSITLAKHGCNLQTGLEHTPYEPLFYARHQCELMLAFSFQKHCNWIFFHLPALPVMQVHIEYFHSIISFNMWGKKEALITGNALCFQCYCPETGTRKAKPKNIKN